MPSQGQWRSSDMPSPSLTSLLVRWEQGEEAGKPLTPEDLCADSPEMLAPLAEAVEVVRQIRHLMQPGGDSLPVTLGGAAARASSLLVRWERSRDEGRELAVEALTPD